ncbi:MAG: preprotein translocase subunit YajC [Oscillospiraceae bacterium]|nr:preprotein translocase subunit YajC [Oscillospiraceae bacterium]
MLTSTAGGGNASMILLLLAFFVLMYFLMIRPEKKKQKKVEAMRNALTVGDEIVTIGGIMGVVVNVTEDNITIETGEDKVRIQFKKWAVGSNVRAEAAEAKAKAKK